MKKFVFVSVILLVALLIWRILFLSFGNKKEIVTEKPVLDTTQKAKPVKIKTITDCKMTFEEAVSGIDIPADIRNSLSLIDVEYFSFDNKLHAGQILINKKYAKDIKEIFREIKEIHFPIKRVVPIVKFNWDDEISMDSNNTSCFNYRVVEGTKMLSAHALGSAVDINPVQNPMIKRGKIFPQGAEYNTAIKGTLNSNSLVTKAFRRRGWEWGGSWNSSKDYQHFEKR